MIKREEDKVRNMDEGEEENELNKAFKMVDGILEYGNTFTRITSLLSKFVTSLNLLIHSHTLRWLCQMSWLINLE